VNAEREGLHVARPSTPVFSWADQALAASLEVLLVLCGFWAYSVRRYTNGHQ
jgi:hypothetical protein